MLSQDGLFAACALRHHGNQIGLSARGDKERCLEAEHLGGFRLQFEDGRVIAKDIIADRGAEHGVAHGGSGPGDGVASKVYA